MKKKLAIAGSIIGIIIISLLGYKTVENVKEGYHKYISNDIVGEINTNENENSISNKDVSSVNEDESSDILQKEVTKDLVEKEIDARLIPHDSDLSSTVEKSNNDSNEVKSNIDGANEEVNDENADAVETALNIINPSLEIDAASALLMDADTGEVIFYKNATDRVYPASTAKLMTALVALSQCEKEEVITIGDEISLMAIDSSRAYLNVGEKLTLGILLEGLLLPSGNDAAYSIATFVGRKVSQSNNMPAAEAVNVFIGLMNEKAESLGLKNTHFMNPDGYDDDSQYTTAYDMAIIAKEALKNKLICDITKKQRTRNVFLSGEDVTWKSGNKLIWADSGVYYKYAIGLKSGTSSLAGRCMVSAAKKEDKTYISVVMNSSATGRWEDSLTLLKYGIEK